MTRSLIADANGDLFGTTPDGGANGYGTVFEIVNNGTLSAPNYASTPTTLVNFNGSPSLASLIADANGDLFGTTWGGGANYDGSVFEITKTATGYASAPTILASFNGSNGEYLHGSLIADANGDLFGTTSEGGATWSSGANGVGTVFEIVNKGTLSAPSYASTPTTLASFYGGGNGAYPYGSLIADANGDLFGTTESGGAGGDGTVFEIVNNGTLSAPSYASTPTILASFNGSNGAYPYGGLIADANGDLFGTTEEGGNTENGTSSGTVFEIAKTASGYTGAPTTLVSFTYYYPGFSGGSWPVGESPEGSLIADANGDLFGTAESGGAYGYGTIFEIVNNGTLSARSYASTPIVVSFNGSNGAYPYGSLIADANGDLFATTYEGGTYGLGGVVEITNSGFVVGAPTIAITTPIADDNVVNKVEAAAGFAISGSETDADGQTVTVKIVNSSSQVIDTLTTTAASGAWSVNVTSAEAQALANGSYTVKADVSNAAGTPATEATQTITVDETTPTVSVGVSSADVNLANDTATVTFSFSAAPAAFSLSDVTTVGGTLSALTEVNATTYTATFTGAVNTDINDAAVSVTAGSWQEVNGNPGAAGASSDFVVDTVTPTVSVGLSSTDVNLANDTDTVTFTFSEAPTAFSLSDVTTVGGTLSALTEVNATTYTATFTGAVNTDINDATVSVTAGSWQEVNGNPGAAGSSSDFVVDTVTPTVSVGLSSTDVNLANDTATVTFTFSEAPTAFSLSDVTTVGGTLSALTEVNTTTYTATFTGLVNTDINDAAVSVTAGSWQEVNGNPGAAGSTGTFTVNTMDHWIKSSSANWSTAADWSNAVPTAKVGADVDASGTYKVSISKAIAAYGLTLNDAGATVTDNAGGTLTLDGTGGSSSPNGVLNIDAGTFDLNGGALRAGLISIANGGELLVSLGAETGSSGASKAIVDDGSITFSDVSPVILSRSISGSGSINVTKGSVTFTGAVMGSEVVTVENTAHAIFDTPIAGTGSFLLMNGGTLEFGAADSENVTFAAGSAATLKLDAPTVFTGAIEDVVVGDAIDLAGIAASSATYSGTTLTINETNGQRLTYANVSGSLAGYVVDIASDNNGGTLVYWTEAPTIAITTPIGNDNVINKAEAAAGFMISGSETGADGRTVTVEIVNSSSQVIDTLTATAASGAWSVNVTSAEAQALANGSYTVKADVSNAAGSPATEATQTITVDETTPTVAVKVSSTDVNIAHNTATVTFTFSEVPAAFSLSDVTAVGGTLTGLKEDVSGAVALGAGSRLGALDRTVSTLKDAIRVSPYAQASRSVLFIIEGLGVHEDTDIAALSVQHVDEVRFGGRGAGLCEHERYLSNTLSSLIYRRFLNNESKLWVTVAESELGPGGRLAARRIWTAPAIPTSFPQQRKE